MIQRSSIRVAMMFLWFLDVRTMCRYNSLNVSISMYIQKEAQAFIEIERKTEIGVKKEAHQEHNVVWFRRSKTRQIGTYSLVRLYGSQGAKPLSVRLAPDNFTAQGSVWCGGSFRGVGVEGALSTSASLLLMLQNSCKFVQLGSLSCILQGLICKWRRISDIKSSFLNCGSRLQGHPSTIYPLNCQK